MQPGSEGAKHNAPSDEAEDQRTSYHITSAKEKTVTKIRTKILI